MPDEQPAARDATTGRFLAGNQAAKGNPYAKRIAEYRRALHEALTPEMIAGVARAMVKAALQGDVAAGRLVLGYAVGKPPDIEADGLEGVTIVFNRPAMRDDDKGDELETAK